MQACPTDLITSVPSVGPDESTEADTIVNYQFFHTKFPLIPHVI